MDVRRIYIYALVNPLDECVFYIGYTNNKSKRLYEHIHDKGKNQWKIRIIKKIVDAGMKPIMNIIDECDYVFNEEADMYEHERLERYHIKKYREDGIVLTNLTDGGDKLPIFKVPVFKYDQFGTFICEYESIVDAGYILPANICHAVDQKKKKSSCGHYWFTSKEKAENFTFKITLKDDSPISQYSLNGGFIKTYKNKKDVYKDIHISDSLLSRALRNEKFSCGGYLWRHGDKRNDVVAKYVNPQEKEILQYDLKGVFLKKYSSIIDAEHEIKIFASCIINCAKGKSYRAGKYIWRYFNGTEIPQKITPPIKPEHGRVILKYSSTTCELIETYPSISKAADANSITWDKMKRLLSGKSIKPSEYIFKYENNK